MGPPPRHGSPLAAHPSAALSSAPKGSANVIAMNESEVRMVKNFIVGVILSSNPVERGTLDCLTNDTSPSCLYITCPVKRVSLFGSVENIRTNFASPFFFSRQFDTWHDRPFVIS